MSTGNDTSDPARRVTDPRATLDHIREGIQILGPDWRYLYVNDAVCTHGQRTCEELLGRTMMEVYPGIETTPMFEALTRCMEDRVPCEVENELRYPDGSARWFELRMTPVPEGVLVLSIGIDDRKLLEAQLRQAQKMEAVGRLAGGVAHDFNNILTAILTFGQFVLEALRPQDPAHADMLEVLAASRRAETLVGQLLAFSRKKTVAPRVVDPSVLVGPIDAMLRRILGEDIELHTVLDPNAWRVRVDPGAFEQVLVNLAVNARDAMPNGGKLTIETGNVHLDETYRMTKGGTVDPGDYVVLAVTDNGCGMGPDVVGQLFEPFFTAKGAGQGTGLGLSTVYGIVKQAGGYIWVYSEPTAGTTFKIYLPRVAGPADAVVELPAPAPVHGTERILVVEDDPQVRMLVVRSLIRCGYDVVEAANGGEALLICEAASAPFDLLLTDVVMPRMSGKALADHLTPLFPAMAVLFMSGYSEHAVTRHGELNEGVHYLQKPFSPAILAQRVRELLDA